MGAAPGSQFPAASICRKFLIADPLTFELNSADSTDGFFARVMLSHSRRPAAERWRYRVCCGKTGSAAGVRRRSGPSPPRILQRYGLSADVNGIGSMVPRTRILLTKS